MGCGNGRNYLPLVAGGLDLVGLDVSFVALRQLASRLGDRRSRLVCGDLFSLTASTRFPVVIGIQVFQHGDRATAHANVSRAAAHVARGGLLCVRANATGTDVRPAHEVTERHPDGGFTVRYLEGPKRGLLIHYFSAAELAALTGGFAPVLPLRLARTWRPPDAGGGRSWWDQWESIWRKPG